MNRFLLSFVHMVDKEEKDVSVILWVCLQSGIEEIINDNYYLYIKFKNGVTARLWNRNKFYAWLSEGAFVDESNNTIYEYDNARPSRDVMWMMYKAIRNYWKNKFGLFKNKNQPLCQ